MIRIVGIDPDFMVIDVLGFFTEPPHCSSAIIGNHQKDVHHINAIDVFRIGDDARVVHRARVEFVASLPASAAIVRAKNAALSIRGFNRGVDYI